MSKPAKPTSPNSVAHGSASFSNEEAMPKNRSCLCWLLLALLNIGFMFPRCKGECTYILTFTPSQECFRLSSAPSVSVLVELGNEDQEFIMWGQADLKHPRAGCGETQLRLVSSSSCMQEICQLRLIRFIGEDSAETKDWLLETVRVEKTNHGDTPSVFNITRPISPVGQVSTGTCSLDAEEEEEEEEEEDVDDYQDEVGDIDWS